MPDLVQIDLKIKIILNYHTILDMKKEFVVKSIDSAPDGAPYVVVSLSSLKDLKEGNSNTTSCFWSTKSNGIFKHE